MPAHEPASASAQRGRGAASRHFTAPLLVLLLLVAVPAGAGIYQHPPRNLEGSYEASTRMVSLTWDPPMNGSANFSYLVWRDGTFLGTTNALGFMDMPSQTVPDPGVIYLVSSQPPGSTDSISIPAVVGVPTLSCEVVTVSTSWQYPHLYVTLHEECLGVPYDKEVVWTAPQ